MADTEQQTQQPVEQQVTSKTPATKQKNKKRVDAGKAVAARTKIAREAQKKALIEAQSYIAQLKTSDANVTPPAPPAPSADTTKKALTLTQWLSLGSIWPYIVGFVLQTRRDQKLFYKKSRPALATSTSTIACFAFH